MQIKQAPRVTANPMDGLCFKIFFCLLLLSTVVFCAQAETKGVSSSGSVDRLGILPNQLAIAYTSVPYSASIHVVGGTAPYQFYFIRGVIPPGLYLNTATGTVAGTPTIAGSFNFRVGISDLPNSERGEVTVYVIVHGGNAPGVTVAVSPGSASVSSAGTQQFSATVSNTSNTAVTWTASAGTISSGGFFTAPSVTTTTTATVTATSMADPTKQSQATVTINPAPAVSIAISPNSSSLISGSSQQFTATVSNSSNTAVTWGATGGTITSGGIFTAPSVSSATTVTITATSMADSTKSAHASVAVNPPAAVNVTVSPASTSLVSAGTQQFTATVSNTSNTGVTWSASSGTISSNGVFTAPTVTSSSTAAVTATSLADTTKWAQAIVSISPTNAAPPQPPPPPPSTGADNTYCGTGDLANFGGSDTVAALPQACINTALANTPSPGNVTTVAAGGSLQNAINSAACGDTIMVQAGSTFSGTFTLPNKNCDAQHWITIRSNASDSTLPAEGTRLTPCYAGVASLPGRPVYYCASTANVMPKILAAGNQAFITQAGAGYYRLIGLEITHPTGMPVGQPDTLVAITDGTQLPHHVIVDRCWIHGIPGVFAKRGVKLDGQYLAVIDSTITDIHAVGTDNQGITSGTGTGPLKIVDNFIEGGSDAILFGGQGNPFGNPQDVEIRRNHLYKPLSQMAESAAWDGLDWDTKVALESKNSNRVLVEGNILENAWGDQAGGAVQGGDGGLVWLGPKNQYSSCPTCDVSDVTFRYNLLRHAGAGTYVFDAPADTGAIAMQAMRYSIHDNVMDDISTAWSRNGSGNGILHRFLGTSSYPPPRNVAVFHNTGATSGTAFLSLTNSVGNGYVNFSFANNLEVDGAYGIIGCSTTFGTATLNTCAPGYTFSGNVIVGGKSNITSGAYEPSAASAVGFANFNNGNGGDYRLCVGPGNPVASCTAASPYANAGTDGRDIGADVTTLNSLISGVN